MTNLEKGQSLFELMVAIAISALIIVALVSLTTNSIQNSTFSRNKARASTYAQQATEWLRGERNNNIDTFIAKVQAAGLIKICLNSLPSTIGSLVISTCSSGTTITETVFQRDVVFTITSDTAPNLSVKEILNADVTVSWTDSGGIHKVTNATSFSDWRQR